LDKAKARAFKPIDLKERKIGWIARELALAQGEEGISIQTDTECI